VKVLCIRRDSRGVKRDRERDRDREGGVGAEVVSEDRECTDDKVLHLSPPLRAAGRVMPALHLPFSPTVRLSFGLFESILVATILLVLPCMYCPLWWQEEEGGGTQQSMTAGLWRDNRWLVRRFEISRQPPVRPFLHSPSRRGFGLRWSD
jgi:hypothetical protein